VTCYVVFILDRIDIRLLSGIDSLQIKCL